MNDLPIDESFEPAVVNENSLASMVDSIRCTVGNDKVLAAVSGGVDSTVATLLAIRALGDRVAPVLVDTGFLREDEAEWVSQLFKRASGMEIGIVDRSRHYYSVLTGITHAEEKRAVFRELFYSHIREEAERLGCRWVLQGTIAPDWIETSGGIKTQHNVLEQIGIKTEEKYGFSLLEPLARLYKDQVRSLGRHLGLPKEFTERQPFPGPGLLIRMPGEFSPEKLKVVRHATRRVEEALRKYSPSQYFAAVFDYPRSITDMNIEGVDTLAFRENVTGVMGDSRVYGGLLGVAPKADAHFGNQRLYEDSDSLLKKILQSKGRYFRLCISLDAKKDGRYAIVMRSVRTSDYMTAEVLKPEFAEVKSLASSILDELKEVRHVFFDVTPKPPATIEYE
jgi:GMP synthase (glutamine-hydrolysing)